MYIEHKFYILIQKNNQPMEQKRLSSEVLSKLSTLSSEEIEKGIKIDEFIGKVLQDILNEGFEVVYTKSDLSMLHSLNLDMFLERMNDTDLKSNAFATPVT